MTGGAGEFSVPDDVTVVFLFNPFGEETLRRALTNLRASVARKPRPLRILYFAPVHHEAVLEAFKYEIRVIDRTASHVAYEIGGPRAVAVAPGTPVAPFALLLAFTATMGFAIPLLSAAIPAQISDFLLAGALLAAIALSPISLLRSLWAPDAAAAVFFAAWTILSALHNGGSWVYPAAALELAALFLLTKALVSTEWKALLVLRTWCIAAAALGALGFVGVFLSLAGIETELAGYGGALNLPLRIKGAAMSPNMLASLCLVPWLALLAPLGRRLFGERLRRPLLFFLALTLAFTMSRALLAVAFGTLLLGRRAGPAWKGVGTALLLGLAVASVRYEWVLPTPAPGAPAFRWTLLHAGAAKVAENPLFGVGPGHPVLVAAGYPRPESPGTAWSAHCTPVDLAATTGLPALLAFLALAYLACAERVSRSRRDVYAVLRVAVAALLFDSLTLDAHRFRHFWLAFGLCAALHGLSRRRESVLK